MAVTEAGAQLAEGHRRAQMKVLRPLLRAFERSWSADTVATSAEFVAFVNDVAPEVLGAYALSERAAKRFYRAFRGAEGVPGDVPNVRLEEPRESRVKDNLERFGPSYVASLVDERGIDEGHAVDRALTQLALTVTKEVLAGGRDSLSAHLRADSEARGYQRVTASNACAFCAMLASRGPVYSTRRIAGQSRQWHRGCRCSVEPVFSQRTSLPENSERFRELWGKTGDLNSFRRALERPDLHT